MTTTSAHERLQRALDVIHNLSIASRGLTAYRAIFEATARELAVLCSYDACYLGLCNMHSPGLFRAALLLDDQQARYVEAAPYSGLTDVLLRERQPVLFRDLDLEWDQRSTAPDLFSAIQQQARAWMGIPLLVGRDAVGVIAVQSRVPEAYDQLDLELLQRLGNVVAVALENATLAQVQRDLSMTLARNVAARVEELSALGALAAEMVLQRPLPALLERALELIVPVFLVDAASIRLYDEQQDRLVLAAHYGLPEAYARSVAAIPVDQSGAIRTLLGRTDPVLVTAREAHERLHLPMAADYDSVLSVPLHFGSRSVGLLTLGYTSARSFDEQQVDLARVIGNLLVIAIEHTRLFEERERQIIELRALGRISLAAGTALDFPTLLRQVYEALHSFMRLDAFLMLVYDSASGLITSGLGIDEGQEYTYMRDLPPPPDSLSAWILRHRRMLHLRDLDAELPAYPEIGRRIVGVSRAAVSWLGVPMVDRDGQPVGVISVQSYTRAAFSVRDEEFLSNVARQVALYVQNVQLFEERGRQLEENQRLITAEQAARQTADTLREVARVLNSSFDSGRVLQIVLRELKKVVDYETASIMLIDGAMLRMAALEGAGDDAARRSVTFRLDEQGGAVHVVRRRAPVLIADTYGSPLWTVTPATAHIRSWLGVPLMVNNMVLGVLNMNARTPHHFTTRDGEVALAFASQAAMALNNARLYEASVARIEQELEIARRIQNNLFPRALPQAPGLDLAAHCLPARETGGDFYDMVSLGDGRLALLVGDVSGKSIPAAMLMAVARSIARSEARNHEWPQTVMRATNRWVSLDVPPQTFVALFYAALDVRARRLAFASAGQLAPLRRRADGAVEYLAARGPTLPLGIRPDIPYESAELPLEPGDTLVCYTDGIVEARNVTRELFGFDRLEALVRDHGQLPPAGLIERILAEVTSFVGGEPQHDDMTLVVVRVT